MVFIQLRWLSLAGVRRGCVLLCMPGQRSRDRHSTLFGGERPLSTLADIKAAAPNVRARGSLKVDTDAGGCVAAIDRHRVPVLCSVHSYDDLSVRNLWDKDAVCLSGHEVDFQIYGQERKHGEAAGCERRYCLVITSNIKGPSSMSPVEGVLRFGRVPADGHGLMPSRRSGPVSPECHAWPGTMSRDGSMRRA